MPPILLVAEVLNIHALVAFIVIVTLAFDFINGFHDAANSIATVVSTRVLSAVRWGVASRIVWAWVLTIPAAFTIAALCFYLTKLFR
jgi:inorganic phosphate transporter, PiT family